MRMTCAVLMLVVGMAAGSAAADPGAEAAKQAEKAAQEGMNKAKEAATQAGEQAKAAAAQASTPAAEPVAAPANPKAVPVPNLPVVEKKELEGGLVIEELKIGDGYEIKPGNAVVAHYHGTLKSDPTVVFDSSFERGDPAAFPLNGVIPGWQKGVPGMKVGGVRRLIIPAALAYGEQSPSPKIPPNSDLVFVIQLVDALQVEDLKVGDGEAAGQQCVAVTTFVIKDKDGKELEKADAAKPYIWIPGEYQPMMFGLEGAKVGGKRRLTIPAAMNMSDPRAGSKRPNNVPVVMEFDLIAVRNLGGPGR